MTRLRIRRSGPLVGHVQLAGDLRLGQQALVWAALARGDSVISGLGARSDHQLLAAALRALGVSVELVAGSYHVQGVGLRGLRLPRGALQAGDSPTTLELLVALLAGQRFGTRVEASGAAAAHSLRTLVSPLRERGAHVAGKSTSDGDLIAPVAVAPLLADELLASVEIGIPQGDPGTKLGLLISGLYARGVTAISEGMLSRDHVERALLALGAPVHTAAGMTLLDTSIEQTSSAEGERELEWPGFRWHIPGDFTLATFVIAAALAIEGSDVSIEGVGLNPTRTAWLEALNGTSARVSVMPKGDAAGDEPLGDVRVKSSRLAQIRVGGERAFRMLDEVPALAALTPACRARTTLRDVASLREQRPDALKLTAELLGQFGIECTAYQDGLDIDPALALRAAHVSADTPPVQKLLACVLALSAPGETQIDGAEQLDACYPGFVAALVALGASIEQEEQA
ncbi:MAG: 5-Enolpyruvylshikimate-3-phosphate synthase [Myxococcaceae bacterium]|nr:5-Enolpyruvylshikimate-3-phosphate synthase [Myxococcaceae bacterium]